MNMIDFEIPCRCGRIIKGRRREDEHRKEFECKKCTGRFSITFEYPSQGELQDRFIADELRPDIIQRTPRPTEDNFPGEAIFNVFMKRK